MGAYALNKKLSALKPYEPVCGEYKIRLDANESFLNLPKSILNAVNDKFLNLNFNRYPDPGCTELVNAYGNFISVDPDCITAGNGSDELISIITSAFLMKGEKALNILPDFSMYAFYAFVSEDDVVSVQKADDYSIDPQKVIDAANSSGAKMIIFSNPCNPTGKGLCREDVRKIINGVSALVVLDEAYMDFWNESLLDEVEQYDNLIILKTFSKAFGMAALRLGFAVSNKKLTGIMRAVKSPYNVNSVTQAAACAALSLPGELTAAVDTIISSKNSLFACLKELEAEYGDRISVPDSCTNFVLVKTAEAKEIFEFLLSNSVAIRYMGAFLRITAGTAEENQTVIALLKKYLEGNI